MIILLSEKSCIFFAPIYSSYKYTLSRLQQHNNILRYITVEQAYWEVKWMGFTTTTRPTGMYIVDLMYCKCNVNVMSYTYFKFYVQCCLCWCFTMFSTSSLVLLLNMTFYSTSKVRSRGIRVFVLIIICYRPYLQLIIIVKDTLICY